MITVLFFASFRERLGTDSERLPLHGLRDAASVVEILRSRGGVWREVFAEEATVMMAVNQDIADPTTPIKDGDELAFFPPVTGG